LITPTVQGLVATTSLPLTPAVHEQGRGLDAAPRLGERLLGALPVGLHEVHGALEERERVRARQLPLEVGHRGVHHLDAEVGERLGDRGRQVGARRVQAALDERRPRPRREAAVGAHPDHGGDGAVDDREAVGVVHDAALLGAVQEGAEAHRGVAVDAQRADRVPSIGAAGQRRGGSIAVGSASIVAPPWASPPAPGSRAPSRRWIAVKLGDAASSGAGAAARITQPC
jgi:hypothetical protein